MPPHAIRGSFKIALWCITSLCMCMSNSITVFRFRLFNIRSCSSGSASIWYGATRKRSTLERHWGSHMIFLMEFKMIMIMLFLFFLFFLFCPVPFLGEGLGTGGAPSRPHLMALETKEKRKEKKKKTTSKNSHVLLT